MSKITFRADDDLVRQLEEFDASKSEVMREALRSYLDGARETTSESDGGSVDDALAERVDQLIAERLDARLDATPRRTQDINVNVTLDGVSADESVARSREMAAESGHETAVDARDTDRGGRKTPEPAESHTSTEEDGDAQTGRKTCGGCGENMESDDVYCPNCGEKTAHRVFCECGDELRTDWSFCPGCGRRTPAADVLNRS